MHAFSVGDSGGGGSVGGGSGEGGGGGSSGVSNVGSRGEG